MREERRVRQVELDEDFKKRMQKMGEASRQYMKEKREREREREREIPPPPMTTQRRVIDRPIKLKREFNKKGECI
eukprot:7024489-Karenia_brevis.AAC.1